MDPRESRSGRRDRSAGLVFDFDGSLVDSSDIKQRSFIATIREVVSAPGPDVQRAYRRYGTLNRVPQLFNAFRDLVGRDPDDRELETMVSTYGSYVQARNHEVRPFHGMQEFLAAHQPKYHLAIASNAPQAEVSAACDAVGIGAFFDHIFGYPTSKTEAIEIVRREWALPRSRIIYIGDRLEDGKVAELVGVPFCRFGPNELEDSTSIVRTTLDLGRVVAAIAPP